MSSKNVYVHYFDILFQTKNSRRFFIIRRFVQNRKLNITIVEITRVFDESLKFSFVYFFFITTHEIVLNCSTKKSKNQSIFSIRVDETSMSMTTFAKFRFSTKMWTNSNEQSDCFWREISIRSNSICHLIITYKHFKINIINVRFVKTINLAFRFRFFHFFVRQQIFAFEIRIVDHVVHELTHVDLIAISICRQRRLFVRLRQKRGFQFTNSFFFFVSKKSNSERKRWMISFRKSREKEGGRSIFSPSGWPPPPS